MALVEPLGGDGVWYVQLAAIGTGSLLLRIDMTFLPLFCPFKNQSIWY